MEISHRADDFRLICFRACENQRGKWHWGEIKRGGKTTEERNQHAVQGQSFSCELSDTTTFQKL